jgi:RNA polymerase subunit RPABC4/transcription elongation factor Spt4
MEKMYCIHCMALYTKGTICTKCGKSEFQEIKIVIHHQGQSKRREIMFK